MGIPGYTKEFIFRRVKQAIKNAPFPPVDTLAIDLSGTIHKARAQVLGETSQLPPGRDLIWVATEIANVVLKLVQEAVDQLQPRVNLLLMVDGVAPGAKLHQQRGRRIKAVESSVDIVEGFDRNWITPGTEFMMLLDSKIKTWLDDTSTRHQLPPNVVYSNHLIPSEGEHKIFEYFRSGKLDATKNHVVFGLDADLIMLALVCSIPNVYLCREQYDYLISIHELSDYIKGLLPNNPQPNHDYVVAMMLLGNDFLPHIVTLARMANTIDTLLRLLQETSQPLVRDSQINIPGLAEFLIRLSTQEDKLLDQLIDLNQRDMLYPKDVMFTQAGAAVDRVSTFTSLWYQHALAPKADPHYSALIQSLTGVDLQPDLTEGAYSMANNYLQMLAWVYLYYTQGHAAVNQDLLYAYHYAPLLSTLAGTINDENFRFVDQAANVLMNEFTVLHQLLAVLPYKSRNLLPVELLPLLALDSPIRDIFPESVTTELEFIIINEKTGLTYDKEIPLIPFFNRQRIVDAVATLVFTPERLAVFAPEAAYENTSSPAHQETYLRNLEARKLARGSQTVGMQRPTVFNGTAGRIDRSREQSLQQQNRPYRGRGGGRGTVRPNVVQGQGVFRPPATGQIAPIPGGYVPRPIHSNVAQPGHRQSSVNWTTQAPVI